MTIEICAEAPAATVPSAHVMGAVPVHDPCEGVTETNVERTGMRFVSVTFVALTVDRLRTVSVYVNG
jgi:hypothetical protein